LDAISSTERSNDNPIGEPGESVLSRFALDALVEQSPAKAGRQLFGEVLHPHDVSAAEALGRLWATGDDEETDRTRLVPNGRQDDLPRRRSIGEKGLERGACHDHGSVRLDQIAQGVVGGIDRQADVDLAVNVRQRRVGIPEDHDSGTIGAQHIGSASDGGSDDLVGNERLTHTAGETVHLIEVAQPLVDRTIRLDDVPQQHDGNERHEQEPRRDQGQPEHHAGQRRVDDEEPPGHVELACETLPQTPFETRDGDPDHERGHDAHHDRYDDRRHDQHRVGVATDRDDPAENHIRQGRLDREHPDVQNDLVRRGPPNRNQCCSRSESPDDECRNRSHEYQRESKRDLRQRKCHGLASKYEPKDAVFRQCKPGDERREQHP
jgi:hypothetical protein